MPNNVMFLNIRSINVTGPVTINVNGIPADDFQHPFHGNVRFPNVRQFQPNAVIAPITDDSDSSDDDDDDDDDDDRTCVSGIDARHESESKSDDEPKYRQRFIDAVKMQQKMSQPKKPSEAHDDQSSGSEERPKPTESREQHQGSNSDTRSASVNFIRVTEERKNILISNARRQTPSAQPLPRRDTTSSGLLVAAVVLSLTAVLLAIFEDS